MLHLLARRVLAWALAAMLLLPIVLMLVLGLGSLLAALGDGSAATVCGRIALGVGVVWLTAVVATTMASGIVALADEPARRVGRRPHLRRRRGGGRRGGGQRSGRERRRPLDAEALNPEESR
jgi:hypothetical protein